MKILAYEHITGGGMLGDAKMSALAPEGETMLRALVDDLTAIPGVEVAVLRDARLGADLPATLHRVDNASDFWPAFRRAVRNADAVWPIAPEQDGMLLRITGEILQAGRVLLGCRPDAVKIATSKRATADVLAQAGIAAIPVYVDERSIAPEVGEVVVKPDDGAGCQDTLLFRSRRQLQAWLRNNARAGLVFQPYIDGDARSLSLLCCDGRARLLACNRQKISVASGVFEFAGVSVGALADADGRYARLASAVARALPGLWGYCGVDFIETDAGPIVVEVNPRLTTSYAGLHRAIGINPAQLVLELPISLDAATEAMHRTRAVEVEIAHAG
ncbi:MAG: ATP-grasp domain-containing protein [Betaproteobacteria bacterium]|nr:ATP-grasp domain-containing protein [Betaproteobacteria bacterium]